MISSRVSVECNWGERRKHKKKRTRRAYTTNVSSASMRVSEYLKSLSIILYAR